MDAGSPEALAFVAAFLAFALVPEEALFWPRADAEAGGCAAEREGAANADSGASASKCGPSFPGFSLDAVGKALGCALSIGALLSVSGLLSAGTPSRPGRNRRA